MTTSLEEEAGFTDVEARIQSPIQTRMQLQNQFDVEAQRSKNEWHSCCLVLDRRAVQYFTQIVIIAGIMLFTIYQLCTIETCESQSVYIGLLTMLIGALIPQPQFHISTSTIAPT